MKPCFQTLPGGFKRRASRGEVKWGVLLWALGVPLPIVLLIVLLRGC